VCAISHTVRSDLLNELHHLQADISDYETTHQIFDQAKPDIVFIWLDMCRVRATSSTRAQQ